MPPSKSPRALDALRTQGVDILAFGGLILLLVLVVFVIFQVGSALAWYLPDELVAVLLGVLAFFALTASKKIRESLREWLED